MVNEPSIADWYTTSLAKIKELYEEKFDELNRQRLSAIKILDAEHHERVKSCKHQWEFKKGLFYYCGDTYDGYECPKCLSTKNVRS